MVGAEAGPEAQQVARSEVRVAPSWVVGCRSCLAGHAAGWDAASDAGLVCATSAG